MSDLLWSVVRRYASNQRGVQANAPWAYLTPVKRLLGQWEQYDPYKLFDHLAGLFSDMGRMDPPLDRASLQKAHVIAQRLKNIKHEVLQTMIDVQNFVLVLERQDKASLDRHERGGV